MAEIKGTNIVILRKIIEEKGSFVEESLFKKLSDKEKEAYRNTTSISWIPLDLEERIDQIASEILYPDQKDGILQLHFEIAKRSYSKFYKIFLTVPSVTFIAKRAAKIWRTYYNAGDAKVDGISDSKFDFIVTDFPELPITLREATNAHLMYLTQLAGKSGVSVELEDIDHKRWVWHVNWKS